MGEFRGVAVVVKRVIISRPDSIDKFEAEVSILCRPELVEAVVVPLAIVRAAPHYSIVLPYMEMGSLTTALQTHKVPLPLSLCIMVDSARALLSLHKDANLIHRDIKGGNILIRKDGRAFLTDLGSAESSLGRETAMDWEANSQPTGGFHKKNIDGTTLGYTAPEIFRNTRAVQASDIYALAMTFSELLSGIPPFLGMEKEDADMHTVMDASYSEHALILAITNDHLRPGLVTLSEQPGMPIELIDLIRDMWHPEVSHRPSIDFVVSKLEQICSKQNIDSSFGQPRSLLLQQLVPVEITKESQTNLTSAVDKYAVHDVPLIPVEFDNNDIPGKVGSRLKRNAKLPIGAFATSGRRGADKMEDRHSVLHAYAGGVAQSVSVCTVFDGHGGPACAHFANSAIGPALLEALSKKPFPTENERKQAAIHAFVDADATFRSSSHTDKSGCTALAAAIWHAADMKLGLILANAGDCRAVLCRRVNGKDEAIRLTQDHNAASASEQLRIEQCGGKIMMTRDGKARVQGHIQVTRALGDAAMKPFGVCADPEVFEYSLDPTNGDEFLILATDGVWDTLSDQQAVNSVRNTAKECGLAAKRIGGDALARGSTDNISVIVIFLHTFDQHDDVIYV